MVDLADSSVDVGAESKIALIINGNLKFSSARPSPQLDCWATFSASLGLFSAHPKISVGVWTS